MLNEKLWLTQKDVQATLSLSDGEMRQLQRELDFPQFIRIKRDKKYLRESVDKYARAKFGITARENKAEKFFANENQGN